jgi:predicted peptidase
MEVSLRRIDKPLTRKVCLDYWVYLPRDYDRPALVQAWPLVLFLHGAGERGDRDKIRRHGPFKRIAAGTEFPFICVAPSCPAGQWWEPEPLHLLIEEVCSLYRVDRDRISATGLSMGGFGTWATAITYPQLFAAIAPICGGGTPYLVDRIAHLPVWTFHGGKDPVVPFYESQRMVDALRLVGNEARLTVFPDGGHDVWTPVYDNPELYDWLLSHRRGRPA